MGLRTDIVIGTLKEKMKEIGDGSMTMMNSTQAKLKAVGADEMMNNLPKKFLVSENFGMFLVGWFDEIFPPETRKQILHRLHVAAPFLVAGLVGLVLLWCFSRWIGCCCRIKMMKAPGMCFRIPRFIFEACPKVCFRVFRALKLLLAK